ncbi:MAG: hypothetical protein JWN78_2537 [Bacteroidota bacterium]|nr:hypothetical protein [Bacteroidota bacterium]
MKNSIIFSISLFLITFLNTGLNACAQSTPEQRDLKSISETLIDFGGKIKNNAISLSWRTLIPMENVHFNIQRSRSALEWEDVGTVNGVNNQGGVFTFTDNNVTESVMFYRLKIQSGNKIEYSSMISVKYVPEINKTQVYPNPTKNVIWIKSEQTMNSSEYLDLEVYNIIGERVYASKMRDEIQRVDLSEYSDGYYSVRIGSKTYKVLKNNN